MEILGAPYSLTPGDAMAVGHLLRPRRSAVTRCVDLDMLLMVPTKTCVQSSDRRSASSSKQLRLLVTRTNGRMSLQGLGCNFLLLQGFLCKLCNVNFMNI
jgi:hypothetical protein